MIVCQCNRQTDRDIRHAVDALLETRPLHTLTPSLVLAELGTPARCRGCFPLVARLIAEHLAALRAA